MKVRKAELESFGLLESLPAELKNLADNEHFVFYYSVDEESASLNIHSYEVMLHPRMSVYRKLREKMQSSGTPLRVAYFSSTFETKDGIFYLFLRTFNDHSKVTEFYKSCVSQDKIVDLNVSTDAYTDIYTSNDFRRSLSYFCSRRLQEITQLYDMVNAAMTNKLSVPLYGNSLKKVVNLVVFDGGVLPEIGGKFRFMIIGENAKLTEQQKEKLSEAKLLLRSSAKIDDIYISTGWCLSIKDGKWRTNIADNDAKILTKNLYDFQNRKIYIPTGETIKSIEPFYKNPTLLYNPTYKGTLNEVLSHPTLFQYYPELKLLPCVYWFGDNIYSWEGIRLSDGSNQNFYFAANERGGYIVINGSKISGSSLSILLHEIQHSIQRIESFATGGNEMLAKFVASVGSESVRKIFGCINKMQKLFKQFLNNDEYRNELLKMLANDRPKSESAKYIKQQLVQDIGSDTFKYEYSKINFYFVMYMSEQGDFTSNEIVDYLYDKIGDIIYELLNNVSDGYEQSKSFQSKLLSEGFRQEDIPSVLFNGYENLYGEIESRSVQTSRFVESQFRNYFYLTKWENAPEQMITVIDGVEEVLDCSKIKAAVETKNDEYVLHFKKGISSEPFIHELGHIVYDALVKFGYSSKLEQEFNKDYAIDINEWFVDRWLSFVKNKIGNEDLYSHLITENEVVSDILEEFFDLKTSMRLKYLQTILSI